jgi:predicted GTPase
MDVTGSGKSAFIKEVTGLDMPVGGEINSMTKHAKIYPTKIDGREVLLVDTPGFNDSRFNDTEILMEITTKLARIYENKVRTSGVIFMHDVSGEKLSGKDRQYLSMFKQIVGEKALHNVTLLTTKWDWTRFDPTYGERKALHSGPSSAHAASEAPQLSSVDPRSAESTELCLPS